TVAVRNVHVPTLFKGKLSFDDVVKQGYDAKELTSSKVPAASLAVARSVVAFTDDYSDTPVVRMEPYVKDGFLVSSTGQLRWKPADSAVGGYFTIDTDATQAVVGFAQGQECRLSRMSIRADTRFAAIYVTAREKEKTLADSKRILIVAMARARNTGMTFNAQENRVLKKGSA